jgi:hypothetical protein
MQWFGKHVSTTEAVFSVWSVPRLYIDSCELSVQFKGQLQFSRKLAERIEARSSEENKRSACEEFACEIEDSCAR